MLRPARSFALAGLVIVAVSRLAFAQAADTFDPGTNGAIRAVAVQPDGKVVVGGAFTLIGGGGTGSTARSHIARLNADGSVDATFDPGADGDVYALAIQANGKITVGGNFTTVGGSPQPNLARLTPAGANDPAGISHPNGAVHAIYLTSDNRVIVGGEFTAFNGEPAPYIARLLASGVHDTEFPQATDGPVFAIAASPPAADHHTPDIVIGGAFTHVYNPLTPPVGRLRLARFDWEGAVDIDSTFNPGANGAVDSIVVRPDGRVLVAGDFTGLGGGAGTTTRNRIGQLNPDGSVDGTFDPGASATVAALALQADGRLLVGGLFTGLGGGTGVTLRHEVGRLNADGSLDAFDPGADGGSGVLGVTLQANGQPIVSGDFATLGGGGNGLSNRSKIGRVVGGSVSQSISLTGGGDTLTWLRSGDGPEVFRVTFDGTTDGVNYFAIGNPTRIPGGWQTIGRGLHTQTYTIRARGYYQSGANLASTSIVEFSQSVSASAATSVLVRTPKELGFGGTKDAFGDFVLLTDPQAVAVTYTGTAPAWTATADEPWIKIADGAGTGVGIFTVSIVNPGNIVAGGPALTGKITISSPTAAAVTLPVWLQIYSVGSAHPAQGQVDAPAQNASGLTGAIALTGWAMDDIDITGLQVYRGCFPFDNPASCQTIGSDSVVYIGDGHFVPGARPDVETLFVDYPQSHQAGWGLLVLSNALPHVPNQLTSGGQGTIQFFVYALDAQGGRTLLGHTVTSHVPTTVTLDNDHIAKPFGNIDTPLQNDTVSGTVPVFGWAITPDSNSVADSGDILIPTDSSTVVLFVDGAPVGTMTYNQCRGDVGNPPPAGVYCDDDVASAFGNATPQPALTPRSSNPTKFRNLDASRGAVASFLLDTTTLTDGQHTIGFVAQDSAGRADGIGSRFFTVANNPGSSAGDFVQTLRDAPAKSRGSAQSIANRPISLRPVASRTGFNLRTVSTALPPTTSGLHVVTLQAGSRLELTMATRVTAGYLVANGELRDLPVGSHLDVASGVFTWAPPTAYLGTYELAFLIGAERIVVAVTIVAN